MTQSWAEDEQKLGFSGPPSDIGWADHEEIVSQLMARVAFFRESAQDWQKEAEKLRIALACLVMALEASETYVTATFMGSGSATLSTTRRAANVANERARLLLNQVGLSQPEHEEV